MRRGCGDGGGADTQNPDLLRVGVPLLARTARAATRRGADVRHASILVPILCHAISQVPQGGDDFLTVKPQQVGIKVTLQRQDML